MFHALFWNDDMEKIRINKYISDAGFCSRREADQLIVDERVTINGVLAAMGAKVSLEDKVRIDGEILHFPKIISKDEEKKNKRKSSKTFHRGKMRQITKNFAWHTWKREKKGRERDFYAF